MESKYPVMSKMYEVNTTRNRNMFFFNAYYISHVDITQYRLFLDNGL